ncbi:MAG: DUF1653 domain-containing protein [Lachnospiraceae bacterium]|nr:DUF1653 domain-containing protein [Lachnospiraceae bacterium]
MGNRELPMPGELYRHFKNKLYQIVAIANHSETGERLVIYQALYGDFGVYARPLAMFSSEVDHEKYPEVSQTYRFEKLKTGGVQANVQRASGNSAQVEVQDAMQTSVQGISQNAAQADKQALLLSFLDAETYEDKLNILRGMKKHIDDKMAYDMAVSLDIVLKEEPLAEKIKDLENCLKTYVRFECSRLR